MKALFRLLRKTAAEEYWCALKGDFCKERSAGLLLEVEHLAPSKTAALDRRASQKGGICIT